MMEVIKAWYSDLPGKVKIFAGVAGGALLIAMLFQGLFRPPPDPTTIYQIPVYPGSSVTSQMYDPGICISQSLVTADPVDTVLDYYRSTLSRAGWNFAWNVEVFRTDPPPVRLIFGRDRYDLGVYVTSEVDGSTSIQVSGQLDGHYDFCRLSAPLQS